MPVFSYKALNKKGKETTGTIEADNTNQALSKLKDSGVFPTSVIENKGGKKGGKAKPGAAPGSGGSGMNIQIRIPGLDGVKTKEVTLFTRQLSTLIDAGLPLVRSLNVLRDQCKPGRLKDTIHGMSAEVESGSTFSEALAKYPKIFNKLYVNMVRAGEAGGLLEIVLQRLAEFAEKSQKLASKVKSALVYPALVIVIALAVVGFLVTVIVPKFMVMFTDMDIKMPAPTLLLMGVSDFAKQRWYLVILGIVGIIVIFKLLKKHPKTKYGLDWLSLRLPVFGQLLQKVAISRFTRTLGTLIKSGVPILQALTIVKDTAGNEVIAGAIVKVHESIREGESISAPLAESKVFPSMVVNMIDVGEETGSLDQMLLKIADNYDDQVDTATGALTSMLEPILIVGMGLVVGFIVIAMFMPLIELMGSMAG